MKTNISGNAATENAALVWGRPEISEVPAGTEVHEGFDKDNNETFYYYVTPDGRKGICQNRNGKLPSKEQAVFLTFTRSDGKQVTVLGWDNKAVITY